MLFGAARVEMEKSSTGVNAKQGPTHFKAHGEDQDRALSADLRRQVFLVFKEAIHNVVRGRIGQNSAPGAGWQSRTGELARNRLVRSREGVIEPKIDPRPCPGALA